MANVGGRADGWMDGRASTFWFPVDNLSTIWGIDSKLCVCIPHMERKVGIGFGRDPIVGGATGAKNRKMVSGR